MSRVIGGLRRLLGAPGWWLAAWLWMAIVAGLIGWQVQLLTVATLQSFGTKHFVKLVRTNF